MKDILHLAVQYTSFLIAALAILFVGLKSTYLIGANQIGLVNKRFSFKKRTGDNPISFDGEAGYQADLLMPGLQWLFWPIFTVEKHPWVQIRGGEIGVVMAQIGEPLPAGAKSGVYKNEFGNFSDLRAFVSNGGQKGIQRPVLQPGSVTPIHPVAFLVVTSGGAFGVPISEGMRSLMQDGKIGPASFGLKPEDFYLQVIAPEIWKDEDGDEQTEDSIGVVTALEGLPLENGDIACRLGGFADVSEMEKVGKDEELVERLLACKNGLHNNYQDFQRFIDNGGRIGLQHDPLLAGAYALNPFLVKVVREPMLVVDQGEVAVIKAYVGQVTQDTSGEEFKYGSLTRPGHRGLWRYPMRTGKFGVNPRCYDCEIVPTAIMTLNWSDRVGDHGLDSDLTKIEAKSREGFPFGITLQVQIHVPDTKAPHVISMVGSIKRLVSEVLRPAVGNHFRDKVQSMEAIDFIQRRRDVQEAAFAHVTTCMEAYQVQVLGVYIQDVHLPAELVTVLTQREIAKQEIATYEQQQEAQQRRVAMEKARGMADQQAALAASEVGIAINRNHAEARKAEASGEAGYLTTVGGGEANKIRAIGAARGEAFQKQVEALGRSGIILTTLVDSLANSHLKLVPDTLVAGSGGSVEGVLAMLIKRLGGADAVPAASSSKETLTV